LKTIPPTRFSFVLLAAVVLILSAAGCSSREPAQTASKPQTSQQSSPSGSPQNANGGHDQASGDGAAGDAGTGDADGGPKIEYTQEAVTLRLDDKGDLRMIAKARELSGDEVTRTASLLDFSAELYENGKLTTVIKASKGLADIGKQTLTASGGVTIKSLERDTFVEAAWVKWYAREKKVIGNGGVKIDSEMGSVEAAAFVADTALKTFTVKDSAKGLEP